MIDYAREYGIDVERLRLEHPAHPGQVGLALEHEALSRDVWVEVARVRRSVRLGHGICRRKPR